MVDTSAGVQCIFFVLCMIWLDGFSSLGDCFETVWCEYELLALHREMNMLASRTLISSPTRINGYLSSESKQVPDRTRSLQSQDSAKILFISWKKWQNFSPYRQNLQSMIYTTWTKILWNSHSRWCYKEQKKIGWDNTIAM